MTDPATFLVYAHDARGRMVSVGTSAEPTVYASYRYGADDSIATEVLGGAAPSRRFRYDPLRRVVSVESAGFSQQLSFRLGGRSAASFADGRIQAETSRWPAATLTAEADTAVYGYDAFGRLRNSEHVQGDPLRASYDSNGNLRRLQRPVDGVVDYGYLAGSNRVLWAGPGDDVQYTPRGNVRAMRGHGLSLSYDVSGRVRRLRSGDDRIDWDRDTAGSLAVRRSAAGRRLYVSAGGAHPYCEIESDGTSTGYVYGPRGLVAILHGEQSHAVVTDARGSVRAVHDHSGRLVARFDYDPYGQTRPGMDNGPVADRMRYRYTGQEFDPRTGLYDYGARLYDPRLARFLQLDPAGQTPSPYAYVADDPINAVDPDGAVITHIFLSTTHDFLFFDLSGPPRLLLAIRARKHQAIFQNVLRRGELKSVMSTEGVALSRAYMALMEATDLHGVAQGARFAAYSNSNLRLQSVDDPRSVMSGTGTWNIGDLQAQMDNAHGVAMEQGGAPLSMAALESAGQQVTAGTFFIDAQYALHQAHQVGWRAHFEPGTGGPSNVYDRLGVRVENYGYSEYAPWLSRGRVDIRNPAGRVFMSLPETINAPMVTLEGFENPVSAAQRLTYERFAANYGRMLGVSPHSDFFGLAVRPNGWNRLLTASPSPSQAEQFRWMWRGMAFKQM